MASCDRDAPRPMAVGEMEIGDGVAVPASPVVLAFSRVYEEAEVLLRCGGVPVGVVRTRLRDGQVQQHDLDEAMAVHPDLRQRIRRERARAWLLQSQPPRPLPKLTWSLIVCTRDRAAELQHCLDALMRADGIERGEVIIVDNAPSDDRTRELVARYPFRYVRTPRAGLNHARAVGADAAKGDVLLYTDDDAIVDRGWIHALLRRFDSYRVGAVTGPTMPSELATAAQHLFHAGGGHVRGFEELRCDRNTLPPAAAGRLGHGANMAFRRDLVCGLRLFDAELDGGTLARSGGDTYALYRVLAAGRVIRYTPAALVWHRDRRELAALRDMLYGYSVGVFAVLTRALIEHRDADAVGVGLSWLLHHHARQTLRCVLRRPGSGPLRMLAAEWLGVAAGPATYWRTRRIERSRGEVPA